MNQPHCGYAYKRPELVCPNYPTWAIGTVGSEELVTLACSDHLVEMLWALDPEPYIIERRAQMETMWVGERM